MNPELESLLRDEGWVRALARRLVRDASEADDLVQEAWLAAQRRPPRERSEAGLRRWVGAVLRNRAREERRAGSRRVDREQASARPEAVPGAAELLERLELRERVVRAVRALGEPYRTAILLRWFEGLSPREIASRCGVPRRTVHSWLARGLEQLRARLRRELGPGRGDWLLALSPLCAPPPPPAGPPSPALPAATSIGALAMTAHVKLAAAGLAAAALVAAYLALPERSGSEPLAPLHAAAAPELPAAGIEAPTEVPGAHAREAAAREALASASAEAAAEPPPAPPASLPVVRGRVVDVDDRPLAGLALALVEPDGQRLATFESAGDGTFEVEVARLEDSRLSIEDPRWAAVLEPMHYGSGVLVVAPRVELGGAVMDGAGRHLAGARVEIEFEQSLRARFSHVLDTSKLARIETLTDAAGRFELAAVPSTSLGALRAAHPGHLPGEIPIPGASRWDLLVELGAREAEVRLLEGRVLDGRGAPLPEAWVALDGKGTRSRPDGSFVLELDEPGASGTLWAAAAGRAPARLERAAASSLDPRAWPDPLELVVEGQAGSIRGRVLDAAGEPVARARVKLLDPTPFARMPHDQIDDRRFLIDHHLEALLQGRGMSSYFGFVCDAGGRFSLEGLTERGYRVEAIDPASLVHAAFDVAPGPEEVELRLPEAPPARRVAGRVVHPDGSPTGKGSLFLVAERTGESGALERIEGEHLRPGADGSFEFPRASGAATHLILRGDGLHADQSLPLPAGDVVDLELAVPRPCHLQVVLADPEEATSFALLDAAGEPVRALHQQGNVVWHQPRIDLVDGRSQAVRSSELARTLVLYHGERELRRVPLELVPGELTTVRP